VQALILAGGEGTRLRPLTRTVPKPIMPLAGRPFLTFMLDWLREQGVDDVLLSCGFLAHQVEEQLGERYEGVTLHHVHEDEPLGTAGPVRLAYDEGLLQDRLFILNGDVLTDMDLTAELAFHDEKHAKATLALIAVDDTSSYGVVPTDENGAVVEFLEKSPGPAPTDRINAGAYVIEREVVERIEPGRAVSFEREVFPSLVGEGLYGWFAEGYWIDIGTPERYLEATYDLLSGRVHSTLPPRDETGSLIYEPALIAGAHIGPQSVLGPHCSVGIKSTVERSVLHTRVTVGSGCTIREAVLADGVQVGDGAEIEPGAMLGEGVVVEPGQVVTADARVEPGASLG
jgi:mannose-1-phosphate guanylyltransferase